MFFKPSRTRSLLTQKKPPSQIPKKHSSIHCLLLASTRKKISMLFSKKIFSTPTGIRTHTKKILVSPTARARPLPAAAAHVDMRSETRDECILPRHRKITDEAFFGSRKDASVWQPISSPEPARIYGQRDRNATGSGIIKNRMPLFRLPVASGFLKRMLDSLRTEHALWVV